MDIIRLQRDAAEAARRTQTAKKELDDANKLLLDGEKDVSDLEKKLKDAENALNRIRVKVTAAERQRRDATANEDGANQAIRTAQVEDERRRAREAK